MTRPESSRSTPGPRPPESSGAFRRERSPWGRLVGAVLIGLAGILLSAVAWNALRATERAQIEIALEAKTTGLTNSFESGQDLQVEHLRELGTAWAREGTEDGDR